MDHAREFKLLIDGKLIAGVSECDVINPAKGRAFAKCPCADHDLLNQAVEAARAAFAGWSVMSETERGERLIRLADAMEDRAGEFASLLTAEQGKPLDQALGEVMGAIYTLRVASSYRQKDRILRDDMGHKVVEYRTPLGVVAAITPWNFPIILLINKLGPALISGNTIVVKPAPTTPLTTLLLGELCQQIFPSGVVNVICDMNDLGDALTCHPDVAKVAFTGSTVTGRKVMASAAASIKRLTLELGGNDAAIVLDDVDAATAARKVFEGAMMNAGQICVAIKRAYVPETIFDEFCSEIASLAAQAVVDDGVKQGTTIGPVQNRAQFERVCSLLADAREHGTVIAGGAPMKRDGYFIPPTIVRDLADDARLVREEQFGPVLPVLAYADIDDVIARANDTEFGLGGTVWGRDIERATEVARRIDAGTIWVNQHLAIDPSFSFRGAKQSGYGAELGEEGFESYSQAHVVNVVELA